MANQARFSRAPPVLRAPGAGQRLPSQRAIGNAALVERIRTIHAESDGTYGRACVRSESTDQGMKVSNKRVARLMRLAGLRGVN